MAFNYAMFVRATTFANPDSIASGLSVERRKTNTFSLYVELDLFSQTDSLLRFVSVFL